MIRGIGVIDWEDELGVDSFEAGGVSRAVGLFSNGDMGGLAVLGWVSGKAGTGEMGTKGEDEADDVSLSLECEAGGESAGTRRGTGACEWSDFILRFFLTVFTGFAGLGTGDVLRVDDVLRTDAADVPISERDSFTGAWTISPLRRTTWLVGFLGFGNLPKEVSLAADTSELGWRDRAEWARSASW